MIAEYVDDNIANASHRRKENQQEAVYLMQNPGPLSATTAPIDARTPR